MVVHRGGKAITRELENQGIKAHFIDRLRVTDEQTIDAVDHVLNEKVNKEQPVCFLARLRNQRFQEAGTDLRKLKERTIWDLLVRLHM